ncbi:hypothetical protein CHS0354_039002 [Potamilus streckersoni]|uniref:Uncharacterized protein n=1 Tax=Potamilus streckersoni TaxID=2493646 RepID=A0AAE0WET6_9BIVA|nr:hypothetical protein CHS0354_039002 [Potamilus streckersoni]
MENFFTVHLCIHVHSAIIRHNSRVYMDTKMNSEEVFHDVKRTQSGDYWTIDDEQIYDIRRRIKSEVFVEGCNTNPSDDYPYLQSEGCMETFNEGIKIAADGYINPAFSVHLNAELEIKNASINSQNSSRAQDTKQDDHSKYNEDKSTAKESLLNH